MRRIFHIATATLLLTGLVLTSSCRSKSNCNCPHFGKAKAGAYSHSA